MFARSRKDVDMLHGPIVSRIFRVAVPLMIMNILQVLYSAADMVIVARSGVEGAVGAIGTTNTVVNLITNLFIGFAVGANVIVAKYLGAKDHKRASDAVHTSLMVGLLFGLFGGLLGFVISPWAMVMMGDEGRILEMAVRYCRIRFLATPLLGLTNFQSAILRAKGNTTTSLSILTLSGAVNVVLNMIFVMGFGMDVDGVAWATLLSQLYSAVALFFALRKEKDDTHVSFRRMRINWTMAGELLRVGLPAGVQNSLSNLANMTVARSVIHMNNLLYPGGSAVLDGHSAAVSVAHFAVHCCSAVDLTLVSFTGQNVGAKKTERLKRLFRVGYLSAFLFSIAACGIVILAQDLLLPLYITDPNAISVAHLRMWIVTGTYPIAMLLGAGSSFLRGMGRSVTSTTISLFCTCGLRIVWVYTVFAHYQTLEALYLCYPVTFLIAAFAQYIAVRKEFKKISAGWAEENALPAN